jgi:ABC-2 type transport system permease protein
VTGLVQVEVTRYRWRRTIMLLVLAAIVLSGVFAARTAWDTRPISAEDRATARAQAEIEANQESTQAELKRCQENPDEYLGQGGTIQACAQQILPRTEWYLDRDPLRIVPVIRNQGVSVALLVIVLLVLAGATFAGSDWASGSIGTQLLFEARRTRLWAAKALAVALASLVCGAVALAVFWVPVWLVALQRDIPIPAQAEHQLIWHLVRVLVLASLAPVLGYALTMLFRHTGATVGVLFGASVAAEILLSLLPFSGAGRLSPSHNAFAWLLGSTQYFDPTLTCSVTSSDCNQLSTLHMWPAGALMGGVLLVALALSLWSFRRRDLP